MIALFFIHTLEQKKHSNLLPLYNISVGRLRDLSFLNRIRGYDMKLRQLESGRQNTKLSNLNVFKCHQVQKSRIRGSNIFNKPVKYDTMTMKYVQSNIFTQFNVVSSTELSLEVQPLNVKSFKPCYMSSSTVI